MTTRLAHTRIAASPTDCTACARMDPSRAFCGLCRATRGLPACWRCGDKRWTVTNDRWGRCPCATPTKEARNEE